MLWMKSPSAQDRFRPMPGLISCAGVTGSGCIKYHAYCNTYILAHRRRKECWQLVLIVNVQFSGEELEELRGGTWENPTFDNMDQLMDERYTCVHAQAHARTCTCTHARTHTHTHAHAHAHAHAHTHTHTHTRTYVLIQTYTDVHTYSWTAWCTILHNIPYTFMHTI